MPVPGFVQVRSPAIAVLLVAVVPAIGSAQSVQWSRQFGSAAHDRAFAIARDASSVYVAGATQGALPGQRSAGAVDAFIRKYDIAGAEIWTRQFGTAGIDEILAIAVDDSGVYVAGDTQGPLSGPTRAPGMPHAFVRKYGPDGTELWTREFGSGRREEALAVAVGTAAVYTAGDTTVTTPPYDDGFVAQFDGDGRPGWSRWIGTERSDRASAIVVNASGVYVAGATEGALPGQPGAGDADGFLRKYDFNGSEEWTRQFGTAGGDEILSMALDGSGLYLAGLTSGLIAGTTGAGAVDAFVSKYDFSGRPVWTRQFGTSAYDDALAVAVSAQGVYVAGNTMAALPGRVNAGGSDAFVVKLTP